MNSVLMYELLAQERMVQLQQAAEQHRLMLQLQPQRISLRRGAALFVGGLLIGMGHYLLRLEANQTRETMQPLQR